MKIPINQIHKTLEEESGWLKFFCKIDDTVRNSPNQFFLDLAKQIGTPVSQNEKGDLILSVKDASFASNDPKFRGPYTNKKLSFHTDRCDVIGFLCLHPAKKGGENQIIRSEEVKKIIQVERPYLYEILCKNFPYKTHTIDSANPLPFCEQPIFSNRNGYFACSYLRVLIDRADQSPDCPTLSDIQREALDFMDIVCERKELQACLTLQRGDILFLNNWTTLHRRTAFEDYEEPEYKRHLLRIWLSMPNSRPLDESFKANFGSVEAGSLRGGIRPIA